MTFPKRGTRTLHVDGASFLWHMSPKDIDYGALATVRAVGGGAILHYWPKEGAPSPAEAVAVIRFALANGWDAQGAGAVVWVGRQGDELVLSNERVPAPWETA